MSAGEEEESTGATAANSLLLVERFEELLDQRMNRGKKRAASSTTASARRRQHKQDAMDANADAEDEADTNVLRLDRQPPCIKNGTMRDYQLEGLNWLLGLYTRELNGILADEMGLGKTLQTISCLGYVTLVSKLREPHIVVVPLSVLGNWMREFEKWCPQLRVVKLHGNKEERQTIVQDALGANDFDVCVLTYEGIAQESSALRRRKWGFLVVDEAHRLKNEQSRLASLCRQIPAKRRLLLTGTPIQNNLHELWALLNFLYPDIFTSSEPFDSSFDSKAGHVHSELVVRLQRLLQGCLLRRLKTEVEKGLPPKTETKLFLPLSEMQASWYRRILLRDLSALGANSSGKGSTHVQNIVMHLRKVCNHPYLFEGAEPGPPFVEGEHLITNSGKMIVLDKLLRKLQAAGSRVLVFVTMARVLDILEDYCRLRSYTYCRLDGNTSTDERESMMEEFNRPGSDTFLFMLSTRAGGLGINLYTADTVILYDSDWNPQADLQAQDRAHRIGQTKPVSVYRFVMEGTLEEKVVERAERKLYLDRLLIEQGRLAMRMPARAKEELMGMIKFGADVVLKSDGAALTDTQIDELISKGQTRTKELADKIRADCQHSLANYTMDGGSDPSKLYEIDGVEYDAKGVTELIKKLRSAEGGTEGGVVKEVDDDDLVAELLRHWQQLRTLRVCNEPGVPRRDGMTMLDVVKAKLANLRSLPPTASEVEKAAWYTIDKKEASDKQWPIIALLLQRFGFERIDPERPEQRSVMIPHKLCVDFDSAVVTPWQTAWRTFRGSQRARGSADTAPAMPDSATQSGSAGEVPVVRSSSEMAQSQAGDSIFAWGCLDWVSSQSRVSDRKSERSAFIVSVPDLLQAPEGLPASLAGVTIRQIACGGRHIVLLTEEGEAYAWGRGTTGCLGLVTLGCAGIPQPLRSLSLSQVRIVAVSCGGEHTVLRDANGVLYACGSGKRGQTGLNTRDTTTLPQRMPLGRRGAAAHSVSCGANHTAVVLADGSLLTCGANDSGVLGQAMGNANATEWGVTETVDCLQLSSSAVLSPGSNPVAAVAAGGLHTLALTRQAHLYAFGAGSWGRLGLADDNKEKLTPTLVKAALHLQPTAVAAGWEHSLLLSADGTLYQFGRVGSAYVSTPSPVVGLGPAAGTVIASVSAGRNFSVACDTEGGVWVWGSMNAAGALGLGEREGVKVKSVRLPTQIDTLSGRHVVSVAAGYTHIVALASSELSSAAQMAVPAEQRFGSTSQAAYENAVCDQCLMEVGPEGGDLIFCDWCNKGYHLECHEPRQTVPPEGEWLCYNCKLERFSSCAVCGMQDDIATTLVLCETPDCPDFGCIHVECLPPNRRPPLVTEKDSDADKEAAHQQPAAAGEGDGDGLADGAVAAETGEKREVEKDAGGKKKLPVAKGASEAKRAWELKSFTWFCARCEAKRGGAPAAAQREGGSSSDEAAGPAEAAAAPAAGPRELTNAQRKLLRQYLDICRNPDEGQLRLLAAVTESSVEDMHTWFLERQRERERERKRAERERQLQEQQQELMRRQAAAQAAAAAIPPVHVRPAPLEEALEQRIDELRKQGNKAYQEGRFAEAQRFYQGALLHDPNSKSKSAHILHSNLSAVYASQQDWSPALVHGECCVRLKPDFSKGYSRLGTALASLKRPTEARDAFNRCLALDPHNATARESLAKLDVARPDGTGANGVGLQAAYPSAPAQPQPMPTKRPAESEPQPPQPPKRPAASVDTAPPPPAAANHAPVAAKPEGSGGDAAGELQQMGNRAYKEQDFRKAVECFAKAISTFQDGNAPAQLYSNRSASYVGLKQHEDALRDADACIKVRPQWGKGYSRRGNALHGMGRFTEAKLAYEQALKLDPSNEVVRTSLQMCIQAMTSGGTAEKPITL